MQSQDDFPMTQGQFQTLMDHITNTARRTDNMIHQIQEDISNIKDDINVIADVLKLERDRQGKLRQSA